MLLARLQNRNRQDGFTLIELLLVTLIIGILATIVFPAVLANRAQGSDDSVRASLPQYMVTMAEYRGVYGLNSSASVDLPLFKAVKHSDGNHFAVIASEGRPSYCVLGYSDGGTHNTPATALVITELDTSGTASCPLTKDPNALVWN